MSWDWSRGGVDRDGPAAGGGRRARGSRGGAGGAERGGPAACVRRRRGRSRGGPARGPGRHATVEPAEGDARPLCSAAAGGRLDLLLEVRELVGEWLALAAGAGVRPPPELVPALLDYAEGRPEQPGRGARRRGRAARALARRPGAALGVRAPRRRGAVERCGGPRGPVAAAPRRGPGRGARNARCPRGPSETWEDRQAFLEELETGLSDADEPLLETALGGRRKAGARRRRRVAGAVAAVGVRGAGRRRGAGAAAGGGRARSWSRCRRRGGGGRSGSASCSRRRRCPPGTSKWSPCPSPTTSARAVHAGWAEAALRQHDVEWGRALGLLELLPHDEAEARAAADEDPLRAAEPLEWTWGRELSEAVVTSVKRHREGGARGDYSFVGYRIDPTLDVEPLRAARRARHRAAVRRGRDPGCHALRSSHDGTPAPARRAAVRRGARRRSQRADDRERPPHWKLSPWATVTYLLGGTLSDGTVVTPKYIGQRRLVEIAVATLATDRALLLLGVPGTAKTWVSEHLAAAIRDDDTPRPGHGRYHRGDAPIRVELRPPPHRRSHARGARRRARVPGDGAGRHRPHRGAHPHAVRGAGRARHDPVREVDAHSRARRRGPAPRSRGSTSSPPRTTATAASTSCRARCGGASTRSSSRFRPTQRPEVRDRHAACWPSSASRSLSRRSTSASEEIRRVVTVFRELRSGVTEDGRAKLKSPSGTLSTAEAISVVTNGLALAATLRRRDARAPPTSRQASSAQSCRTRSRDAAVSGSEYLETVARERGRAGVRCTGPAGRCDPHGLRDSPPRPRVGPHARTRAGPSWSRTRS